MFRLKTLCVEDYKNLKNIVIDFETGDGFTMLIGNNGSGKSNILELISGIFHDAYRLDTFRIQSDYDIEYSINNDTLTIIKRQGRRQFRINGTLQKRLNFINNNNLPKNVVAVYSGEETRLWVRFFAYYHRQYIANMNNPSTYTQNMKLMFVNRYYWNIALLLMLISERDDIKKFIEDDLKIQTLENVMFRFNSHNIESCQNETLKAFLHVINPDNREKQIFSIGELKERLSKFEPDEQSLFNYFVQAFMPKDAKLIDRIKINFNEGLSTESLSEGEKKLVLVKAVLEFLTDEKTLVLFDEPDSHVNEAKKSSMYHMMKEYKQPQIIMTTHSPTLTRLAKDNERIILQKNGNGNVDIVSCGAIEAIEKISDGIYTSNAHSIVFISQKPLILVEGIGDINYIARAISVLGEIDEKYKEIDCEFLPMGGASKNAEHFTGEIKKCIAADRTVLVILDRDEEGGKGMNACISRGNDRRDLATYKQNSWYYFMLPKTLGHTSLDFLIEDYFSCSEKKAFIQIMMDNASGYLNEYPNNLKKSLKADLGKKTNQYQASDLEGFKVLLDKIHSIITGNEICTSV